MKFKKGKSTLYKNSFIMQSYKLEQYLKEEHYYIKGHMLQIENDLISIRRFGETENRTLVDICLISKRMLVNEVTEEDKITVFI